MTTSATLKYRKPDGTLVTQQFTPAHAVHTVADSLLLQGAAFSITYSTTQPQPQPR